MLSPFFKVTLPIGIKFQEWSILIQQDLPELKFPMPANFKSWRDWALEILNTNNINNVPIPTKNIFPREEDWHTWAKFFISSLK